MAPYEYILAALCLLSTALGADVVAAPSPPRLSLNWWGQVTQSIVEARAGGGTTAFQSVFTQAWAYEQGYFMQAALDRVAPNATNDTDAMFVKALNLTDRDRGSFTYVPHQPHCLVCPTDLDVARDLAGPGYLRSTLHATNVTTSTGVRGCEEWVGERAGMPTSYFVLPLSLTRRSLPQQHGDAGPGDAVQGLQDQDPEARLILIQQTSPSYNETTTYDYWWTSAPLPLFGEAFANWTALDHGPTGPCTDERTNPFGCMGGAAKDSAAEIGDSRIHRG